MSVTVGRHFVCTRLKATSRSSYSAKQSPETAENFSALCACGAYNDIPFHRIMPGFMIQTGDISLGPAGKPSASNKPMLPFEVPKGGTSINHLSALNQEVESPCLRQNEQVRYPMNGLPPGEGDKDGTEDSKCDRPDD
ncbi:Peptidyl-prolyl cis-trans isomerase-like 3 [Penicillium citrinum]|uniref:Peptidyl-prolyl cis-trans isomerase n=1 Tax=Penicillium citrinum TaxID=5077 RepID=A0A9W9PBV4_PENCI|nr:Peptidyl-prolyl cis-trans isomerase-like 3 [Penicillium citrinum]KAJ5241669.1 Peptidyl-prolyl cis-trans isomerase-like 3 [Penicillium citrinum]